MSNRNSSKTTMDKAITDDAIFKVAKEVVIKFIEVGRLSPESFPKRFEEIYTSIENTVRHRELETGETEVSAP